MPGRNQFLDRLKQQKEEELSRNTNRSIQIALDTAVLVLHADFGWGPKRTQAFVETFKSRLLDWAKTSIEDHDDDKDMWYSITKMEEALKEAMGEFYVERKERFRGC